MQRTRSNRARIIALIICVLSIALLVLIDQLLKGYFLRLNQEKNIYANPITVIKDFFYFTFIYNEGSAYGFLGNAEWAQTFFKILTPVALVGFGFILFLGIKNFNVTLMIGTSLVISGTIGNFIDRLLINKVIDFLTIFVFNKRIFGIFNLADVFLCVGVVLVLIHFLFLDKNAIFRKSNESKDNKDGN